MCRWLQREGGKGEGLGRGGLRGPRKPRKAAVWALRGSLQKPASVSVLCSLFSFLFGSGLDLKVLNLNGHSALHKAAARS